MKNKISLPNIKNIIAVASGKGGVGKSTVALTLTESISKLGFRVGLLDADIYGPSIALMTGVKEKPTATENSLIPIEKNNIKYISMGFLVDENQPIIWRGPMVHGILTQFLTQVEWGELDFLIIDMPPGTGDAQLTMSQNAPLTGAVIVTTPQELSLLDARRGIKMFQNVNVPLLGVIENMSGYVCENCDHVTHLFQTGGGDRLAAEFEVDLLGKIPLDKKISQAGDEGFSFIEREPESQVAALYKGIAQNIVYKCATKNPASVSKPLSLQWQ
jgi:ATP-binding protein involved in chromosome partitioning